MNKGEGVTPYLTRIQNVRDELTEIGETPIESELVHTALNNFTKEWETFVQGISERDNLPGWDRLWVDFTQEEMTLALVESNIRSSKSKGPKSVKDKENVALASKGKAKKGPILGQSSKVEEKKKKDFSKIKCFKCGEFGHYSTQCPKKKKEKKQG